MFSGAPTTLPYIFPGNSRDDIKPVSSPMALYQSQQVYIIQAGARHWAQIFAQGGSWVGAWERTAGSLCNRPNECGLTYFHPPAQWSSKEAATSASDKRLKPQSGRETHLSSWDVLFEPFTEPAESCSEQLRYRTHVRRRQTPKLTDVEHLPRVTPSKRSLIIVDHLGNN